MTQRDLADASGLERSYISMLETGHRQNASYTTVAALARGLGVTTAEIYRRAGVAWPAEPALPETWISVDDTEKLSVLRRLAHYSVDALLRLERAARILLLEEDRTRNDAASERAGDQTEDEPDPQAQSRTDSESA